GSTVEAEYTGRSGNLIKLRTPDGRELGIHVYKLSPEDREWIDRQAAGVPWGAGESDAGAEPQPAVAEQKAANTLRAFTEGPWKGYNAVYQQALFDAALRADGDVVVFPKEDGKHVGKPIRVAMLVAYQEASGALRKRRVTTLTSDPDPRPRLRPETEITLEGTVEDNVAFTLTYAFEKNSVAAWGHLSEPETLEIPSLLSIGAYFPQSHEIPLQMPMDEQRKLLGDYKLVFEVLRGEDVEIPYYSMDGIPLRSRSVTLVGDLYGSRRIEIRARDDNDAPLERMRNFFHRTPYEGFFLGIVKQEADSKAANEAFEIRLE
ncbi:MAG: hypothetical protein JW951_08865, partial [Lentisphaerae bacterium]|nr:hypothetical protein [Lentisphaerota bacterium]